MTTSPTLRRTFLLLSLTLAACSQDGPQLADARHFGPDAAVEVADATNSPTDAPATAADASPGNPSDATIVLPDANTTPDAYAGPFHAGDGTTANPFQIANATELLAANNSIYATSSFQVIADIDLSGVAMDPIGTSNDATTYSFAGLFDGNGHTISNWTYSSSSSNLNCVGFFSTVEGIVLDLTLSSPTVSSAASYVGTLAGCNQNGGKLIRDTVIGGSAQSTNGDAGGLVGTQSGNYNSLVITGIENCSSGASATTLGSAGGLVALNVEASIVDSYATGEVNGAREAGGLVCDNIYGGNSIRNYATGLVDVSQNTAGLDIGDGAGPSIVRDSFWDTDSTGQLTSADGTGVSALQLTDMATFADWDFTNTWKIGTGEAPSLRPLGNVAPMTPAFLTPSFTVGSASYLVTLNAYDFNGDAMTYKIGDIRVSGGSPTTA